MEELNYLKIVLDGYQDFNSRKFLKNYFIRQWKKAEENHYTLDEFFIGLRNVVKAFEEDMKLKDSKRVHDLHMIINSFKNQHKLTDEQEDALKICQEELEDFRNGFEMHSVYLMSITNGAYVGHLTPEQVKYIKDSLLLAYGDVSPEEKEDAPPQKKDKTFQEYFNDPQPKDIEGLKEFLKSLGDTKVLGIAMKVLDHEELTFIDREHKRFVNTFLPDIKRADNISNGYRSIYANIKTKEVDNKQYQLLKKQILIFC